MTPSETIIEAAKSQDAELDANGTKIVVRVLTPIEQFRYKKVVGKFIDNPGYMLDATMAASVRSIGGAPMPFPQNEGGVEFILEKLGSDGWGAVQDHFMQLGAEQADKAEIAKN